MDSMKVESIVGLGTKVTLVKSIKKIEDNETEIESKIVENRS